MTPPLKTRLISEALGTGLLVCTVVGSGIMAAKLTKDTALALLGNTLPTGAILVVLITMLAPVSGAHFNPVVSLVMALRRELPWPAFAPYVLAQITGGCLGTLVAHAMFDLDLFSSQQPQHGSGTVARGIRRGVRLSAHHPGGAVGPVRSDTHGGRPVHYRGLLVHSFRSFANPAVTIARAISNTFAGIAPAHVLGFIVAQTLGALVALGLPANCLGKKRHGLEPATSWPGGLQSFA